MRKLGLDVDVFSASAERMGIEGKTPLYAAMGSRLAAIVAVADPIKEATPGAIAALHELGLKVAMNTGDNRHTGEAVARQLAIDRVIAVALAEGKVDVARRLDQHHGPTAAVGAGITETP